MVPSPWGRPGTPLGAACLLGRPTGSPCPAPIGMWGATDGCGETHLWRSPTPDPPLSGFGSSLLSSEQWPQAALCTDGSSGFLFSLVEELWDQSFLFSRYFP